MRRFLATVGTAAALCCGVVACGDASSQVSAPRVDRVGLGVVAVDARIGGDEVHSSGIVVDGESGLILTAAHGVWGARSLKLTTSLGVLHGRIVARAPCDDLALVETQPRIPGLVALPTLVDAGVPAGASLRSVGRRRLDPGSAALASVSIPVRAAGPAAPVLIDARLPRQESAIPLDAALVPEVTGGPVLDGAGRVVGMALSRDDQPGVVVPWSRIRALLDRLTPGPREMYVGWRDQYRCVGAQNVYARALRPAFRPADAVLNAPVPASRLAGTEDLDG
jgi:S1-C subfamily serine protease